MVKVVVGGMLHETNVLSPFPADYAAFSQEGERPALVAGTELLETLLQYNTSLSGFIREVSSRLDRSCEAGCFGIVRMCTMRIHTLSDRRT